MHINAIYLLLHHNNVELLNLVVKNYPKLLHRLNKYRQYLFSSYISYEWPDSSIALIEIMKSYKPEKCVSFIPGLAAMKWDNQENPLKKVVEEYIEILCKFT
jgi:hypothetical protein